jgi:hypothetical protein
MHSGVAMVAKRNQVVLGIVAGVAAERPVVNLKIGTRAARLTLPAVAA